MVTMIRSDLDFILAQIKIAEADARGEQLLGTYLPNSELPWGLRRVDGSNNNLTPGQDGYGAAGELFPRTDPAVRPNEQDGDSLAFGPPGLGQQVLTNTDYGVIAANNPAITRGIQPGDVVDADPRIISNLIVDQTANNPAAIFKALQDAGLSNADAFTQMGVLTAAVQAVQDAKAEAQVSNAAVTTALAEQNAAVVALNTAIADANPTLATLAAYQAAAAAAAQLSAAVALVTSTTQALAIELVAGPSDPNDAIALATAQSAAAELLALATTVLTSLQSDINVLPADVAAAQALVDNITQELTESLGFISAGNGITNAENGIADGVAAAVPGTSAFATTLTAQIEATLASPALTNPGVVAAQAALDTAEANYALALTQAAADSNAVTSASTDLRDTLTDFGITLEEAPLRPGETTPDILKATLYIGNVAADEGLSAPFNGWMTLFGQFFDHGLDLVAKGGFGTVYIPLQPDDPLYVPGSATNFMALTRATVNAAGEATNLVTPFVDQNQTYTSHASHQVFLREYERVADVTDATGRLLDGNAASGNGLATWADVKAEAIAKLGIQLSDIDIHSVPLLRTDPYGNFFAGQNGYAQVVVEVTQTVTTVDGPQVTRTNVFIEGREGGLDIHALTAADLPASFVAIEGATVTLSVVPTGVAFLDDIAHNANPGANEQADNDSAVGLTGSNTGFYDNELLDAHYITGDGRGNENIGLTAVHHVFHSEHNRQVDLIQNLLIDEATTALAELSAATDPAEITNAQAIVTEKLAFLNEWLDTPLLQADLATATVATVDWNGERVFQAAKLPTEMQYQHLVFEEFARKVQPAVNLFNDYDGTLNPAILAEFAHTVYRFGHSMLTETVDRFDAQWNSLGTGGVTGDQIGLIEAFLNPLEFAASGFNANTGLITAEEAAGVIVQGMTRQRGNEIDEFVTEALRNNLVGLPLDLAAINIARGRETGVPTLNAARADFFEGSGDTQVKPYASWFEFMQNLKNPASVINFIAAYGTHDTILAADDVDAKRAAATLLVLGGAGAPADRLDFLNATGEWRPAGSEGNDGLIGGVNNIDFWIGGLAEKKLIFGGMLGSTFNFVFEAQLEALQNGDRFYYLSRLANLNLTAQLENNKFSEMIHRNTTATHLPGDAFARPDFFLEADISKQYNADLGVGIDPTGAQIDIDPFLGAASGGGTNGAVLRTDADSDGIAERLEYTGAEHVVLGGTSGNDTLIGGKGDDTLWGDAGDDRLEGGDGNDFIFGGDGNDIITDLFGIDEIRSNGGDDVVSAGRGIKLIITDTGNDWVWGGVDDDEVLAGQGDDFVNGGDGADFLIGGEGNDWLESGTENGLMLGDNGDLVQGLPIKRSVDSRVVGHDVLVATGGNADFDAETGDDVMVGGLGTDRFFGQFGFDWATYKNDPFGLEADMNVRLFAPPTLPASPGAILDRYAQTEALSGSRKSDILRGDDEIDLAAGAGPGALVDGLDHALYDFNVDLVRGLDELLGAIDEAGAIRFSGGNILLGGDASDIIEGRGGNDVIDGDAWLNVRIARVDAQGAEVETQDTMAGYQARVLAGTIKVAELQIVREVLDTSSDIDIAEYSGVRADYDVSAADADGFVTVTHLLRDATGAIVVGGIGTDGVDKLKNIERLLFSDQTIKITDHVNSIATGAATITASGPIQPGTVLTASSAGIVDAEGVGQIVFYWQVELVPGSGEFTNIQSIVADEFAPITGPTFTLTDAEAGLAVRVLARFKDDQGVFETAVSASTAPVGGAVGALVIPDPAATLGLDLQGVPVDGAPLDAGTIGILEDLAATNTTAAGTPFTFTADELLANIRAANPGAPLSIVGAGGIPIVSVRLIDGDPLPGTLTFANGTFTFTPAADFNGGVTFQFDVLPDNPVAGLAPFPAEATLEVIPVNDAPTGIEPGVGAEIIGAVTAGSIIAQLGTQDVDLADRPTFTVNAGSDPGLAVDARGVVTLVAGLGNNQTRTLNLTATDEVGASVNETIRVITGPGGAQTINGNAGDDIIFGLGGADILNGNGGDDMLIGGAGADRLNGGAGNDTVVWTVGDGRDVVDGGLGGTDTFVVNGDATAETYTVFAAADWLALGGNRALTSAASDIVITRGGTGNGAVVAELDEIEEIVINTGAGNDTVAPVGNFNPTNLSFNTITVRDGGGQDRVNATGLTSAHHIAFFTNGNDDTLIGGRVQDEVFGSATGGAAPTAEFFFTGSDIAELKKLVRGQPSDIAEDGASGIRDLEGTGNNVANPGAGAADQPFIRLTDARHGENGSVNPIHDGLDPRTISNIIGAQEANLPKNASEANILFMAFGQYVDHGLDFLNKGGNGTIAIGSGADNPADLTRGEISGYDEDGNPQYLNKASPFVDQNQAYGSTEMVGQLLRESNGSGGVGAQLLQGATDPSNANFDLLPTLREALLHHWNADTVFHDAGKAGDGKTLKQMYAGLVDANGNFDAAILKSVNENFMGSGFQLVGDANNFANILDHYVAGDLRVNENYSLTSVHTIWARNHNYHVDRLLESGFDGTQEELFQAAKIVNESEYQRVVFNEFADYLLGGLKGGGDHGHDEYNPDATAQISQEFAAAAYRFGHSQIGQTITILDADGNPKSVNLFDAFLNPTNDASAFGGPAGLAQLAQYGYVPQPGYEQIGVSNIIGGIVGQQAEEVDFNVVDAVRNDLVRIRADLFAFNVARGWDVGLGTLNQVRAGLLASTDKYVSEAVELSDANLQPYTSWEDFQARNNLSNAVIQQFKQAYPDLVLDTQAKIDAFTAANPDITLANGNTVKGIDRVDLWVGGLAETHINGGVVGSTFWVILHEQFDRLQEADRFYYLDRVKDSDFYEALKELEFSDIVARTTGLTNLPDDIFSATDSPSDDASNGGDGEQETEGEGSGSGTGTETETEDEENDDDTSSEGEDDDETTVPTPPTGNGTGTGTGTGTGAGTGTGTGTGTSTSAFVVYLGTAASDTAFGAGLDDQLSGGDKDDNLFGFAGDDIIAGGDGDDHLDGGAGNDNLVGNVGDDTLKGGAGNDELDGGAGDDRIDGGDGGDTVYGGDGRDVIKTGAGNDTIFAFDGDGNDVIDAGDAAGDSDTLDMSAISGNITVFLSATGTGSAKVAGGDSDSIKGIENVITGSGDDVIVASTDANLMEGGLGDDTFVFNSAAAANGDTISDFQDGDLIDLTPLFASLNLGDGSLSTGATFNAAGEFRLKVQGEDTIVEGNADADADVEFAIRILGRTDLEQKDFA